MDAVVWIAGVLVALVAFAFFSRWLLDNPRRDVATGLVVHGFRVYCKLLHRLEVRGLENVPDKQFPGPLIVVANHTAGIDPMVVQGVLRFEVRWLMAEDMMISIASEFWEWSGVIGVARGAQDASSVRKALRHLKDAEKNPEGLGAIGIFPEGGIERPPEQVMPFLPGVGVIIKKGRCPVIPVLIEGTPQVDPAWASMWRFSRSRVTFGEPIDYTTSDLDPIGIANDLRKRYLEWTGWPANNVPGPWDPSPEATLAILGIDRADYDRAVASGETWPEIPGMFAGIVLGSRPMSAR